MTWSRRYWLARWTTYRGTTRVQRRAHRQFADDAMVRIWLDVHPNKPLGALSAEVPLSGRRLRQSLTRLQAAADSDKQETT